MNIIDTSGEWLSAFDGEHFDLAKWEAYIDRNVPGAKKLCLDDMRECMEAGFTWEKDFLPVLNAVQRKFLWQLFTEGIAMVFEQEIVGDPAYFHQDTGGWKEWCERNEVQIREAFRNDLETMKQENQRYFGDWTRFEGYGDTGYYLGTRFVRFLLELDCFDHLISRSLEDVQDGFERFVQ